MDLITYLLFTLMLFEDVMVSGGRRSERKRTGKKNIRQDILVRRLLSSYTKQDPPMLDSPTEVRLGIYVNSFYSISEQTMEFSANFYLRQAWRDPRLAFLDKPGFQGLQVNKIRLEDGIWAKIWVPDVFFRNEKRASYHDITVANRLLTLNATGHLWYVTKISATLSCPMKLQKYPLDTQTCPMMFESFGYTMDTMYFAWLDSPVQIDEDLQLPQFSLQDKILYDCSQNYTAGAYPCSQIDFVLSRDLGFYLIQVYVPTMLVVTLSWVSFWINIDAIPARVSIGLLTVLTMTTQNANANSSMPRVSYVKAMDIWMSTCLIFVFAALVEFSLVNVISRKGMRPINPLARSKMRKLQDGKVLHQPAGCCRRGSINIVENGTERREPPAKQPDPEGKFKARRIDKISRKCFPLAFLLFNIIYWIIYTLPSGPSSIGS